MKKVLLSLLLAFVCVQVSHAQDLPLSLNDVVVFGGNSSFNPATGKITFGDNYSPGVGWEFDTPINHTEYPYLKLVFTAKNTVNMLDIKADKVGGGEISIGIPKGVTAFIFNLTSDVERIYLQCSNWDDFDTKGPWTLTLISATLLAPFATEKVPLDLDDIGHGEWWCGTASAAEGTINLNCNWEFVGWDFEEMTGDVLDANVYVGAGIFFEPMEFQRVDFRGTTDAGADFYSGIPVGGTSIQVSFAEPIWRIGFQYSNWDGVQQDNPVIKIKEAYLLKKAPTGLKKIVVNTGPVDVYTILGIKIRSKVEAANALTGLKKGIYIVDGKKVVVTKD